MKFHGIVYSNFRWSLIQTKGYDSASEAEKVTREILSWSNNKNPVNVVHEMWLNSLEEWPTPEEQDQAKVHSANLKNQEFFLPHE